MNQSETNKEQTEHVYTNRTSSFFRNVTLVFILALLASAVILAFFYRQLSPDTKVSLGEKVTFTTFKSESEFEKYLTNSMNTSLTQSLPYAAGGGSSEKDSVALAPQPTTENAVSTNRFSETNVQVLGIDEADIVKTDGVNIYVSSEQYFYPTFGGEFGAMRDLALPYPEEVNKTQIVSTSPELSKVSEIDRTGQMLLTDDRIVVLGGNEIYGYDKNNSNAEVWKFSLENNSVVTSRLLDGNIFVLLQNYLNSNSPCPIPLLSPSYGAQIKIACTEIYHPNVPSPVDSTFTLVKINPSNGEILERVSFVGTSGMSVSYMSKDAFYITYPYQLDVADVYTDFLLNEGSSLMPVSVLSRIQEIASYDISASSKYTEVQLAIQSYRNSLDSDDALAFDQEITNKQNDYVNRNKRELDKTAIVKITLDGLKPTKSASVPGNPLNQFSLDEYNGSFRIATTVGDTILARVDTVSDVYVLDSNLNITGSITDLASGERIYSVRFIGDSGYIVTFEQTDPLFVADLSDTKNPRIVGQLEIPGYSSYLHPIDASHILGVGKQEENVKLSLFDISDPSNPREVSKYLLNEYWSEALSNHHAFLQDDRHKIVFVPGSNGGYVLSYSGNELSLEKAISESGILRALYINDTFYAVSRNRITSYDQNTWENSGELEL